MWWERSTRSRRTKAGGSRKPVAREIGGRPVPQVSATESGFCAASGGESWTQRFEQETMSAFSSELAPVAVWRRLKQKRQLGPVLRIQMTRREEDLNLGSRGGRGGQGHLEGKRQGR